MMIKVANRDGEGVGEVVGFQRRFEAEFLADGEFDLILGRFAGAGEDAFHLGWRVVDDSEIVRSGDVENCAAGVGHEQCRFRIFGQREDLLDGQRVYLMCRKQFAQVLTDFMYAIGKRGLGFGANDAPFDDDWLTTAHLEDGIAGASQTRIDAENEHGVGVRR